MSGLFVCDHCGAESGDPGSHNTPEAPWFHDRTHDYDLCNTCRNNWEPDGPLGQHARYQRVATRDFWADKERRRAEKKAKENTR